MKPTYLRLRNFLSHANTELDLDKVELASIIGDCGQRGRSNGAGKSAILGAISYALYGSYLGASDDDLVRDGYGYMEVELKFEFGQHRVRVMRVRDAGKGSAELFIDSKLRAEGIRNVNAAIIDLIKMNFEVFTATAFFLQGELDRFTGATPSKRKEYLSSILELTCWQDHHDSTRDKIKQIERKIDKNNVEIKTIKGAYDFEVDYGLERDRLEREHAAAKESLDILEEKHKSLLSQISDLEKLQAEHRSLLTGNQEIGIEELMMRTKHEFAVARQQIKERKAALKNVKAAVTNLVSEELQKLPVAEVREAVKKNTLGMNEKLQEIHFKVEQKDQVMKILDAVLGGEQHQCPLCDQDLTSVSQVHSKQTAALQKLREDYIELEQAWKVEAQRWKQVDKLASDFKALKTSAGMLVDAAKDKKKAVEDMQKVAEAEKERLRQVSARLAETSVDEDRLYVLGEEAQNLERLVELKRAKIMDMEVQLFSNQEVVEKIEEAKERLSTLRAEKKSMESNKKLLEVVKKMFAKRGGIPAYIIENAITDIEEGANDILRAFGGDLRIVLESLKQTKITKRQVDTLEIFVNTAGGHKRLYHLLSGGEKAQVNIAIRLALSSLLSNRFGVQIDALFIDESMGAFDEANRATMLGVFRLLRNRFRQVFVISHQADLRDVLPDTILVTKKNGVSSAKVDRPEKRKVKLKRRKTANV